MDLSLKAMKTHRTTTSLDAGLRLPQRMLAESSSFFVLFIGVIERNDLDVVETKTRLRLSSNATSSFCLSSSRSIRWPT